MAYQYDKSTDSIVISGWEKGITSSPYTGIANMRNMGISYYPSVAYINYRRQAATLADSSSGDWFAGSHSTNVSNNAGWIFSGSTVTMTNPVAKAVSPVGLNYVLDTSGNIWKQSAVNSSTFNLLGDEGRIGNGAGGLAYWNNYLIVFGDGMIEFCGNGTGDAGVTSANWNISSSNTTVTVTSSIIQMSAAKNPQEPYLWTGTVNSGSTSATLNTTWNGVSGNYFVQFDNSGPDTRTVTFTNGSANVSWSSGLGSNASTDFYMYQLSATNETSAGFNTFNAGSAVTFSSTGTLPTGLVAGTTYYLVGSVDLTGSTSFYVSTTAAGTVFIAFTNAGTGTLTMTLVPSNAPPIQNTTITGFGWGNQGIGSTTITLATPWLGANGTYNIIDPIGNMMFGIFVYNSTIVNLVTPAIYQYASSGTFLVQILNPNNAIYKTWNSKVDSNLYFTNGHFIGRIAMGFGSNPTFIPSQPQTYGVNYGAVGLLEPQDVAIDMTDLRGAMFIAGNFDTYTWDYVSTALSYPNPVGEQISGIINILNNIYILAGQKGNVYVSNGAAAQLLYKIPDYIAGVIDPIWNYGGYMFHRGKLYFQALCSNTSGTNILAGVFSLNVSATLVTDIETAGAFTMEAQNSYGLVPSASSSAVGLLMDDEPSANGQDSYYSAWSNGSNVGGIDYNDTSLWQSFQPVIETDIIPIGTFFAKKTTGQIEFKLDRPMASGDQIKLYWRGSLSASYVQVGGTFTNLQLSDAAPSDMAQLQWVQFMIELSAASSGSSFIPIRELRLHLS